MRHHICLGLLATLAMISSAKADIVTFRQGQGGYTSSLDNWLGSNLGHNGANNIASNNGFTRTSENLVYILRYDNIFGNNPGQVPFGTAPGINQPGTSITINSATVSLQRRGGGTVANIHSLLVPWNAASNNLTMNVGGPTSGLDPGAELSAAALDSETGGDPDVFDVTSAVQDWYDGSLANNGFGIQSISGADINYYANESGEGLSFLPLLTIDFTINQIPGLVAPEPGSFIMWGAIGSLSLGYFAWRRKRHAS